MKKLIYAAAFILTFVSSVSTAQATGVLRDAKALHLVHSTAYPNNASLPRATYHFGLYVEGYSLSQLLIDLPNNISINEGIEIRDQFGQKIAATVSITNGKALIAFAQPVSPDTTLEIDMKGITTPGHSFTWLFPVHGKMVGVSEDFLLGTVRIQTYGR